MIASLVDATLHQRRARIEYFSFNSKRTKAYTVDPYRLVYYRGGLYLYARAEEYDEVRTFAVERIQKIEVSEQGFELPADFDASAYARGAFGIAGGKPEPVEIVFDAGDGRLHPASASGTRARRSRRARTDRWRCA